MSSRINLRRDSTAGADSPTLTRGEIFVQLADLQLVVGLEDELTTRELLPVRWFDVGAQYAYNDIIVYNAVMYKCINAGGVTPGTFDTADWEVIDAQALYDLHVVTLWDSKRSYIVNDVIHYEGSIFAALIDGAGDPGVTPEDWKDIGASAVENIIQEFQRVLDEEVTIYNHHAYNEYFIGDVVYQSPDLYRALENIPAGVPEVEAPLDPAKWEIIHHAVMYNGDTKPANPNNGLMWWDPQSGETFIWYVDSTSGQWVSTIYGAPGAAAPFEFDDNPLDQDEYIPVTGLRYVWYDDIGVWRGDPDLFVKVTGSTMTGALMLRATAPQSDYEAVHKVYVDTTFQSFFTVHDVPPIITDGVDGDFWFVRE